MRLTRLKSAIIGICAAQTIRGYKFSNLSMVEDVWERL